MKTKNLGQVQAIFTGVNPPTNKKMLWYDEGNKVFKYYNYDHSAWIELTSGGTGVIPSLQLVTESGATTKMDTTFRKMSFVNTDIDSNPFAEINPTAKQFVLGYTSPDKAAIRGTEDVVGLFGAQYLALSVGTHSRFGYGVFMEDTRQGVEHKGVQLMGFGESGSDFSGVDYSSLIENSLVPRKYVDDAIAAGGGATPTLQQVTTEGAATDVETTFSGGIKTSDNTQKFGYLAGGSNAGSNLAAFGTQAAENNQGNDCSAFGELALQDNQGDSCQGFGYSTLQNNQGNNCLALGTNSMINNEAADCIGIGTSALQKNKGAKNIGIGDQSLSYTTTRAANLIAIGYRASAGTELAPVNFINSVAIGSLSEITKDYQVVLGNSDTKEVATKGVYEGKNLTVTNGNFSTLGFSLPVNRGAVGQFMKMGANGVCEWADAGGVVGDYVPIAGNQGNPMTGPLYYDSLIGKNFNEAVGVDALTNRANPGVTRNTAIGGYSLYALTVGEKNVSVGDQSATVITSGNRNTFIGSDPNNFTQGNDNVFIGSSTPLITGGNYNVFINSRASSSSWGTHNLNGVIAIGNFTHEITEDNAISIGDGDSVIKGKSGSLNSNDNFININGDFAVKDWNFKQVTAGLNIYHSGAFKARIGTDGNLYLAGTKVEYNATE